MALTLAIGGVQYSPAADGSLSLNVELNRRRALSFTLISNGPPTSDAFSVLGQIITLTDGGSTTYFKGYVDSWDFENPQGAVGALQKCWYKIRCVDFNSIADRRVLKAGSWTGVNAGNIVADIIDSVLHVEGVTDGFIDAGPILPQFDVTTPTKISDVLNQICQECQKVASPTIANGAGYAWFIDINKAMHFFNSVDGSAAASFSILDSPAVWKTASLNEDRSNYANRVIVHSALVLDSSDTVDTLHGISPATRNYNTTAAVGTVPTITVNGVSKTVGIDGVDTGKDWYYSLNTTIIRQDAGGTLLTGSDALVITYMAILADNYVQVDDLTEQGTRAFIEGGSGIHELAIDNTSFGTVSDVTQMATSLLANMNRIPKILTVVLDQNAGVPEPGQIVPVYLSTYSLYKTVSPPVATPMMIQKASATFVAAQGSHPILGTVNIGFLQWTIELTNGSYQDGWEKILFKQPSTSSSSSTVTSGGAPDTGLFEPIAVT